jgi:hypothetical protein
VFFCIAFLSAGSISLFGRIYSPSQNILPFSVAFDLRFREWVKRDDRDALPPGILYRLADQPLANFPAT